MADDLPPSVVKAVEARGELLHSMGLLTPAEARQWIEETKDEMREIHE